MLRPTSSTGGTGPDIYHCSTKAPGCIGMISAARNLFEKHPWTEWLIPSAFCLILLAQMLCSVQQMSQQGDEAIHLYAGYRLLKCGDYVFGREHPPLAKTLAASLCW